MHVITHTRIVVARQRVPECARALDVLTHAEYDRGEWKEKLR